MENYRSALPSQLRSVTTDTAPTLAYLILHFDCSCVTHLIGEHLRVTHQHSGRAGGWLSDYTTNLYGRVP